VKFLGEPHVGIRRALTAVVGLAHFTLFGLGITRHLTFTVDSNNEVLQMTVGNPLWIYLHAAIATWIAIVLLRHRGYVPACGAACGVLIAWGVLTLLWGLTTVRPVSLVGPFFVMLIAVVAYLLTEHWAVGGDDR